ncbi:TetR/AcrR family transcriptional regulator [Cryptosporangium aurantiacum]|uniref:Transcriptional regulator, TetR family n=1 Tax=Cryptosporangium aurantiacum TaxID=134849 RepID=A0A1M7RE63_9ACTN|nr:TetR/AcrR family transcriptional regulator [Cryptosporangium aurantiacum]SHN44471.1 transcriptional regulator, TetR family [Cryptosporangium aurantiacum]
MAQERPPGGQRVYGGLSPAERVARRREQFLDAAVDVFGTVGWAGSTVADICRAAKLSPRFFYEEFPSRELLFLATTDRVASQVEQVVRDAIATGEGDVQTQARHVLTALAEYFTADPRTVRVALMESLATPEFREQRRLLLSSFVELAARLMRPLRADDPDDTPARERKDLLSAGLLVGGVVEVLIAGATANEAGPRRGPTDLGALAVRRRGAAELVEHLTALFTAAARLEG